MELFKNYAPTHPHPTLRPRSDLLIDDTAVTRTYSKSDTARRTVTLRTPLHKLKQCLLLILGPQQWRPTFYNHSLAPPPTPAPIPYTHKNPTNTIQQVGLLEQQATPQNHLPNTHQIWARLDGFAIRASIDRPLPAGQPTPRLILLTHIYITANLKYLSTPQPCLAHSITKSLFSLPPTAPPPLPFCLTILIAETPPQTGCFVQRSGKGPTPSTPSPFLALGPTCGTVRPNKSTVAVWLIKSPVRCKLISHRSYSRSPPRPSNTRTADHPLSPPLPPGVSTGVGRRLSC